MLRHLELCQRAASYNLSFSGSHNAVSNRFVKAKVGSRRILTLYISKYARRGRGHDRKQRPSAGPISVQYIHRQVFSFEWKQTAGVLWRTSLPASSWKDARCLGHTWGESITDDSTCVWRRNPAGIWKPERGIICSINQRAHTKQAFVQTLSPRIPLVAQNVSEWRRLGGKTSQDEWTRNCLNCVLIFLKKYCLFF